jgi:8-oxo-dGTP diphosphatase
MVLIDKLAWIYLRDRRVLITRSHGKTVYYLPGGKREPGESDAQALTREVLEELSVHLLPETLQYLGTFEAQAHGHPEGVIVRMTCYSADYESTLAPSMEIEAMDWFTYADRPRTSTVDHLIFDWLLEQGMID